jgi:hypothetical protein
VAWHVVPIDGGAALKLSATGFTLEGLPAAPMSGFRSLRTWRALRLENL